ncbi:nitrate reductase alpha subunit [Limimaricola variabilis]|uniref:Nitrate reductase alpha subunit n=1 Tax=Limimaricola variabilis TaxID=1492771 RepID=A0ABR6HN63_9RHOB|nr:hypothetical protein [Limimaricola variabilis]MBB3711992.1 nitrate reductase alpha subunit [Limimaricola variabilis]
MENVAEFLNTQVVSIWNAFMNGGSEVLWGELTEPSAMVLFTLALLSGIVSRSATMFIGATALAGAGLYLQYSHDLLLDFRVASVLIGAQVIFLLGGWAHYHHARQMRSALQALESENEELQTKLDREVIWRIAGYTTSALDQKAGSKPADDAS